MNRKVSIVQRISLWDGVSILSRLVDQQCDGRICPTQVRGEPIAGEPIIFSHLQGIEHVMGPDRASLFAELVRA